MDHDLSIIFLVWIKVKVATLVRSVRYKIKFCLHFCLTSVALWFAVFSAIFRCRFCDSRNALLTGKLIIKHAELLGVRMVVECSEKFDRKEKFVVIMNHQSCLDIIAMSQLLIILGDLAPVVRKLVKVVQPFGLAVSTCDGIFLENRTKHASRKALDEKVERLRQRKRNVAFFPDGTRSDGDHLLPFKKGAFHLSVQSTMRVLPVVIQKYPFINQQRQIFGRGTVKVKILDPIAIKAGESVDEFTMRAFEIMNNEFRLLHSN